MIRRTGSQKRRKADSRIRGRGSCDNIGKMSAAEKAAGLMMIGFRGTQAPEYVQALIESGLSGVVLFSRNVQHTRQVRRLTAGLQRRSRRLRPGEQLLIAADQEGGPVSRFDDEHCWSPAAMGQGAACDCQLTAALASRVGCALRRRGVNMNLAPVLDVNTDPDNPVIGVRSYGSDPELVAKLGASAVEGFQRSGVAAVGKHFCGHGDTAVDSHCDLPVVEQSRQRLRRVELVPFRQAIAADVAALMTAHAVFTGYDSDTGLPATLSQRILKGLLREDLGFSGVVMTDCMEMGAIADNFEQPDVAVQAIAAGADLVLYSHSQRLQKSVHSRLTREIKSGGLPQDRVHEALRRVLTLKKALGHSQSAPDGRCVLDCPDECSRFMLKAAARAVTVICGENHFPLEGCGADTAPASRGEGWQILIPGGSSTGARSHPLDNLAEGISSACPGAMLLRYTDGQLWTGSQSSHRSASSNRLLVLAESGDVLPLTDEQISRSTVFSVGGPFVLSDLPRPAAAACTYDASPASLKAALRFLLRGSAAPGLLPVDLGGWCR